MFGNANNSFMGSTPWGRLSRELEKLSNWAAVQDVAQTGFFPSDMYTPQGFNISRALGQVQDYFEIQQRLENNWQRTNPGLLSQPRVDPFASPSLPQTQGRLFSEQGSDPAGQRAGSRPRQARQIGSRVSNMLQLAGDWLKLEQRLAQLLGNSNSSQRLSERQGQRFTDQDSGIGGQRADSQPRQPRPIGSRVSGLLQLAGDWLKLEQRLAQLLGDSNRSQTSG
jgi:hypothetical protein